MNYKFIIILITIILFCCIFNKSETREFFIFGDIIGGIGNVASSAVGGVGNLAGDVIGGVGNAAGSVASTILPGAVGDTVGGAISGAGNAANNVISGAGDTVGNVLGGAKNVAGGVLGDVAGGVLGGAKDIAGSVLGNAAGGVLGDVAGGILGNVGGNMLGNTINKTWGAISGPAEFTRDILYNVVPNYTMLDRYLEKKNDWVRANKGIPLTVPIDHRFNNISFKYENSQHDKTNKFGPHFSNTAIGKSILHKIV